MWGIYFEFIIFANNKFVETTSPQSKYVLSWSIIQSLQSTAYLISPIIAISLLNNSPIHAFSGAIIFFASSIFGIFALWKHSKHVSPITETPQKQSLKHVLNIWKLLIGKIWPLQIFFCAIIMVDSFFWTIGVLLSETLRQKNLIGGLLIPAYYFPTLFAGFIATKITPKLGKKHTAFICGIFMGLSLAAIGIVTKVEIVVLLVLCMSFFLSIVIPALNSTYEDYIHRLGHTSEDMIGLQNSAGSLSYILGPIAAGAIANIVGIQPTFAILGIVLTTLSLLMLIIVPRKIHMPQTAISQVES
jgi:diacylglycerol kinase